MGFIVLSLGHGFKALRTSCNTGGGKGRGERTGERSRYAVGAAVGTVRLRHAWQAWRKWWRRRWAQLWSRHEGRRQSAASAWGASFEVWRPGHTRIRGSGWRRSSQRQVARHSGPVREEAIGAALPAGHYTGLSSGSGCEACVTAGRNKGLRSGGGRGEGRAAGRALQPGSCSGSAAQAAARVATSGRRQP